jgi:hypothetical protein
MVEGTFQSRSCSGTAVLERKDSLKLKRPVVELGFLPVLPPFRHSARSMPKADTLTKLLQLTRKGERVELVKGTEHEVSDLLNSGEESLIAQTLRGVPYTLIGSIRTKKRKRSTKIVRATVKRLHKVQVHCS